jgi:hypothetical protein
MYYKKVLWDQPINEFWSKFTYSFCKMGSFNSLAKIVYSDEIVQLTKSEWIYSKILYRIGSRAQCYKYSYGNLPPFYSNYQGNVAF